MLTMQAALLALNEYWTQQGCLVAQPMNTEVGAGTLNPSTFLRVQGPEPWRVAYVEPSVRPDDSRYGKNPNRLQTHTQYQVILKPEPGNAQELFLGSLSALGVDVSAHDIRFVEDNWASPALGAWGLGWEVWLDGLEITQFTYFQQAGGLALDPVSVEITYGMERILMALQEVSHFKDLAYAPGITYGEAFGQNEYEMSRYYLDEADIDVQRTLFDAYATEAQRMIEAGLPVPAYSYVLKCSQTFNVLDARGAVSTTERARSFARMRRLAHDVAGLWAARREELGHPLGTVVAEAPAEAGALPAPTAVAADLVFEIGFEELPPAEVTRTEEAVRAALTTKLAATRLRHGDIDVIASPRRVVATVASVAPQEEDSEQTSRGPRASAAFDADGRPTKAAEGFARGHGVGVEQLTRVEAGGHEYVAVVRQVKGRTAAELLATVLPTIVTELRAEKNMHWNAPQLSYSRPIRWIVALLGEDVVPFSVSTLVAGRTTQVHRNAAAPRVDVPTAVGYRAFLHGHGIIADAVERRDLVVEQAGALAESVGGTIDLVRHEALVDEITNLVEWPTPILGGYDPSYLDLPGDVLVTVMRKHQRYLPVQDASGALLPYFVTIANGSCDHDVVRRGNEAVLRARYEDAAFFWRADLETPLDAMRAKLSLLTFEERLGSMADRADRIAAIAAGLADAVELQGQERRTLDRAASLVKFDLGSQMVTELSSLAGIMAKEYAARGGETPEVASAIFETELPRAAGDALPTSTAGALLALADRFDLLAGLFAIGAEPTGSSDPFGLRRSAVGLLNILRTCQGVSGISLEKGLALAASHQRVPVGAEALGKASQFVVRRFEQQLLEAGHPVSAVRAVLPLVGTRTPQFAEQTLGELLVVQEQPHFVALLAAAQRVRRIVPAEVAAGFDVALFTEAAEEELAASVAKFQELLGDDRGLAQVAVHSHVLVASVNRFFDEVLVMDKDPQIKANRLGLLASVKAAIDGVVDWDALD